jgi:hypothetical protein
VDRNPEDRHGRHRKLEQATAVQLPSIRLHRPECVGVSSEQPLAPFPLFAIEVASGEELGAGQRVQDVGERRGIEPVISLPEHLES